MAKAMGTANLTTEEARQIARRTRQTPNWFWRDILHKDPWLKQRQIMYGVWNHRKTAVRSCHGAGKSFTAADVGLAFLFAHPGSIVITTAPTGRQVRKILWQEWAKSVSGAAMDLGGEPLQVEHRIAPGWYAFGFSTDIPTNFQGLHADYILVIADEAAGISPPIFDAIESLLTSQNARLLAIGNPTDPASYFAGMFKEKGVYKIHISAYDTPNLLTFGITEEDMLDGTWEEKITGPMPYPELVTPWWVADRLNKWGIDSPMYQARVLGNFPEGAENTIIPLTWVELAQERWWDMEEGTPRELGVDIARFGGDESAYARRAGAKTVDIEAWRKYDLMETAGRVRRAIKDFKAVATKIDVIGMGSGVHDRLKELGENVFEIDVNKAPKDKDQFHDLSSELWWNLRSLLDPNPRNNPWPIGLPPDDELLGQLTTRTYTYTSNGRIRIESKEDLKKRGFSSPDRADAVVLAYAPTPRRRVLSRVYTG